MRFMVISSEERFSGRDTWLQTSSVTDVSRSSAVLPWTSASVSSSRGGRLPALCGDQNRLVGPEVMLDDAECQARPTNDLTGVGSIEPKFVDCFLGNGDDPFSCFGTLSVSA